LHRLPCRTQFHGLQTAQYRRNTTRVRQSRDRGRSSTWIICGALDPESHHKNRQRSSCDRATSRRKRTVPIDPHGRDYVDRLGVWNIFANPDMPNPQAKIRTILCDDQVPCPLSNAALLDRAIARFKTPGLRDLSHSAPYMHNGQFATLKGIIDFYIRVSDQSRAGTLRNGAVQLQGITLTAGDIAPLVAFLKSLNEDYQ
jgi:hypothetical protein